MHVLKTPNDFTFERVGIKGKVFPVKDLTGKSGIIYIETEIGHETTIVNHVCDVYYYILEGTGYFEINNNKEPFSKGDLVVIPAESIFTYKGNGKMLRMTTPAFYPEQEETLG
jgi:mannose-6-phosphate isomerase-like protein (cupin superfamily)